jgi:hypothetical protein
MQELNIREGAANSSSVRVAAPTGAVRPKSSTWTSSSYGRCPAPGLSVYSPGFEKRAVIISSPEFSNETSPGPEIFDHYINFSVQPSYSAGETRGSDR